LGHEAAEHHKNAIYELVQDKLSDCDIFVFCTSLGGGSGSGSSEIVIDILSKLEAPILVITILPMNNEDAQTKDNSIEALAELAGLLREQKIHNLIVVDNAKIEAIFSDVGQMDFYNVSNKAIVEPLDVFNSYSAQPSPVKGLDPTDLLKVLVDGEGLSLYGCMDVINYEEDTSIAEAIVTNLDSGLLASGFDLKQTKYAGVMILANKSVWQKIPSSSINYAMEIVQDAAGTPMGVFKGIYEADIEEDVVKVYSFFSGLALPDSRISELRKEVDSKRQTLKTKTESRNLKLKIDTGKTNTVSTVEKIKSQTKKKNSMFGKAVKNIIDKRKK
jgi:cell division GTPase FtsZ